MPDQPSVIDVALAPARLVIGVLQAIPRIADDLDRIASFQDTLDRIAGLADALAAVAETTKGMGQLAKTVVGLERAAEELARAVQPLQGVAQRLNRLGRRGVSEVSGSC